MANFEVDTEQRPGELVVRLSGDWTSLLSMRLTRCWRRTVGRQPLCPDRSERSGVHRFDRDQTSPGGPHMGRAKGPQFCIIRGSERIQRVFR